MATLDDQIENPMFDLSLRRAFLGIRQGTLDPKEEVTYLALGKPTEVPEHMRLIGGSTFIGTSSYEVLLQIADDFYLFEKEQ